MSIGPIHDVAFLDVLYRRRELYPKSFGGQSLQQIVFAHLRNGFLGLYNPADITQNPRSTSGPLERVYTKVSHDCVELPCPFPTSGTLTESDVSAYNP